MEQNCQQLAPTIVSGQQSTGQKVDGFKPSVKVHNPPGMICIR